MCEQCDRYLSTAEEAVDELIGVVVAFNHNEEIACLTPGQKTVELAVHIAEQVPESAHCPEVADLVQGLAFAITRLAGMQEAGLSP